MLRHNRFLYISATVTGNSVCLLGQKCLNRADPAFVCVCVCSLWPVAVELAMIMDRLYGGVCYAGIDTDPELKYPKGAGRVAFSNQQSYIAAISARFVQLQHGEIDKRVGDGTQWGGGWFELSILKLVAHTRLERCNYTSNTIIKISDLMLI